MVDYDRIMIGPSAEELALALAEAVTAANANKPEHRLAWPLPDLDEVLAGWRANPAGAHRWSDARHWGLPIVELVWWEDFIGRKHHRVFGGRGNSALSNVLTRTEERPLLWLIYPERAHLRQRSAGWELFVTCACGAAGAPAALGWMGTCCGPCHDRREAGEEHAFSAGPKLLASQHDSAIEQVAFSADGHYVTSLGLYSQVLRHWDIRSGTDALWNFPDEANSLAVSPRDATVAVGGSRGVWLRDGNTGKQVRERSQTHARLTDLTFSPNGAMLAGLGKDFHTAPTGQLLLWDVASRQRTSFSGAFAHAHCVAFSPDGRTLAVGAAGWSRVLFQSLFRDKARESINPKVGAVLRLTYSLDGRLLAIAGATGNVLLWDLTGAGGPTVLPIRGADISALLFAPDGRWLVTLEPPDPLRIWDVGSGREHSAYRWHLGHLKTAAFSPDGQWLATGGQDGKVKLWPWPSLLGP